MELSLLRQSQVYRTHYNPCPIVVPISSTCNLRTHQGANTMNVIQPQAAWVPPGLKQSSETPCPLLYRKTKESNRLEVMIGPLRTDSSKASPSCDPIGLVFAIQLPNRLQLYAVVTRDPGFVESEVQAVQSKSSLPSLVIVVDCRNVTITLT